MKNQDNRRQFLKTAGAALVAAAVPATILAQRSEDARPPSGNNLKQMAIFGGVSEPLPNAPGVFGQADFQFQMLVDPDSGVGVATISDVYFSELNSHVKLYSVERGVNDLYIFRGTCLNSRTPEFVGKQVVIKVQILPDDNCDIGLTIEDTPLQGLLLPAIQKVRDKNGR